MPALTEILPAILGFLGGLIAVIAYTSRTKAETEKIRVDTLSELQSQIDELRDNNTKLYDDQIKRRAELDRIHGDMTNVQNLLSSEIARNVSLAEEVRGLRYALGEKEAAIHNLGLQIETYKAGISAEVKKQTGSLAGKG